MTGTDLCVNKPQSFPVIFEPPFIYIFMMQQPLVCQDLLIMETSRSHSDTSRPVGILWTNHQPDAETST